MPTDPQARLESLLATEESRIRRRFLEIVGAIRDDMTEAEIAAVLQGGRVDITTSTFERGAVMLAGSVTAAQLAAGNDTAEFFRDDLDILTDFDATNTRAVSAMRNSRLRLIREFSDGQRAATREALMDGIARGANPREQARALRGSIGLTRHQQQIVDNYRRQLRAGNLSPALQRQLRDRRFDRTLESAIRDQRSLTDAQIERMVDRYRSRWVKFRAETIARTEALRAVHEGSEEMYAQAIEVGDLDPDELIRQWNTARDERVRSSHRSMHGQVRPIGEPFVSGNGNRLRFPGDISAPASETIHCRCVVSTRIAALPTEIAA